MAEIAAGAGLTKGTTYLYFKSKEDIYEDVLRERSRYATEEYTERLTELNDLPF